MLPKIDWLYLLVYGVSLSAMLWIFLGKLLPVFRQSAGYIGKAWSVLSVLTALFMLADYYRTLRRCFSDYAPRAPNDEIDQRFVEAPLLRYLTVSIRQVPFS